MGNTIADYGPAVQPLDGSELIPLWQNGQQKRIAASVFSSAVSSAILNDSGFLAVKADLSGANTIGTVAANMVNVITVAGIAGNVTTVVGALANINAVATNIGTIANVNANMNLLSAAVTASLTSGAYGNAATSNVPKGATSFTLTAGSGGANGTNISATFAGGNFAVNPTILFDIVGGAVTNVRITGPGLYIGSTPTPPTVTLPGAAGGAALTLTVGALISSGNGYWAMSSDGSKLLRYTNNSGAAQADATVGGIYTAAGRDAQAVVLQGNGPPGYQVGVANQYYDDLTSGLRYGPKTSLGWPAAGVATAKGTTIPATRTRVDMRVAGAVFPVEHWTFTRASASTDMLETDPYTYAYTTYANDVPVMRTGGGFYTYMRAQQFLSNPTAPASHTTASNVAVGTAILLVWGPAGAQVQVSAGSAVGSGFTTVTCNGTSAVKAVLTITTAGTITVTVVSGAPKLWNLRQIPPRRPLPKRCRSSRTRASVSLIRRSGHPP